MNTIELKSESKKARYLLSEFLALCFRFDVVELVLVVVEPILGHPPRVPQVGGEAAVRGEGVGVTPSEHVPHASTRDAENFASAQPRFDRHL